MHVVNIARTADSEIKEKNSSLSIHDIMHKYQCYNNSNHPLNYNIIHNLMSDSKSYTENKFDLDSSDHDNQSSHAERYLVY